MKYKAVGKNVYCKKNKESRWEIKIKTMTNQKAKIMVERLEMEQNEWQKKK